MEDVSEDNGTLSPRATKSARIYTISRNISDSSSSQAQSSITASLTSSSTIGGEGVPVIIAKHGGEAAEKEIIREMSVCGVPTYPWDMLAPILESNLVRCLDGFRAAKSEKAGQLPLNDYEARRIELVELLRGFYGAPFTLQRICELILEPDAHYKSVDALLRGFETLLSVSSTIPVASGEEVERLRSDYVRVMASEMPGRSSDGNPLRRSDTVDMEMDLS